MILIIDNYDSFTYNLYQACHDFTDRIIVKRNDEITIEAIKALQPNGIILSPGPGRPEQAGICIDVIKAFAKSIPMLGVCLGMQAIAAAFNSQVVSASNITHGKPSKIFHDRSRIYDQLPLPFEAGRYHSLMVDRDTLSSEIKINAENNEGIIMGIVHTKHPIYGVQFHPESILSVDGQLLIGNFVELCMESTHVEN